MFTIGLMSGTSLDGLDGVLVQWSVPGADDPAGDLHICCRAHRAFPPDLRKALLALNHSGPDELHRSALSANHLSLLAADLVADLLEQSALSRHQIRAIGFHGQTVRHRPGEFDGCGYTLQIHNASLLAERSGIDVVCDFRTRDVAAGGQGAPLVPAFHASLWAREGLDQAVLNLGGIANLTLLTADGGVGGFDCGPANVLMDLWAERNLGQPYDHEGAWAAQGRVLPSLLAALQAEPFFARPAPKSTGRDLFHAEWLDAKRMEAGVTSAAAQDVQATLCELTAWAVDLHLCRELPGAASLHVCGGGALNRTLMRKLESSLKARHGEAARVETTAASGLAVMDVEAAAFAWLALRFVQGLPGNLPAVTGARGPRILGALYPG